MASKSASTDSKNTTTSSADANGTSKVSSINATGTMPTVTTQTAGGGFILEPRENNWPPPVFIRQTATMREKFFIENRWHAQWAYYDQKASEFKSRYYYYQTIVVVGSLVIPALISLNSAIARGLAAGILAISGNAGDAAALAQAETYWRIIIDALTVMLSLCVAGAAALEGLYKYGESWNSYRAAAEELQAEKSFYDMGAGPYENSARAFSIFVERVEGIITKQNGNYFQAVQQSIKQQSEENSELIANFKSDEDGDGDIDYEETVTVTSTTTTNPAG
ncbi:MAG: DUF4231 domain-containing protein [Chloroflexota bacterium]